MSVSVEYLRIERALATIVCSYDPIAARDRALADELTPAALKEALKALHEDGLRLTALLVAKLRFERLLRGSSHAERWFDLDPGGFAAAFRRYHEEVPPTAFFPQEEAKLFEDWSGGAMLIDS